MSDPRVTRTTVPVGTLSAGAVVVVGAGLVGGRVIPMTVPARHRRGLSAGTVAVLGTRLVGGRVGCRLLGAGGTGAARPAVDGAPLPAGE